MNYKYFLSYALYGWFIGVTAICLLQSEMNKLLRLEIFDIKVSYFGLVICYGGGWLIALFTGSLLIYHLFLILNDFSSLDH